MKVSLLLGHPERHSFNGAMFDTAVNTLRSAGHTVATSDLYPALFWLWLKVWTSPR